MRLLIFLGVWLCAGAAIADTVVAARNIRPGTALLATDVIAIRGEVPGSFADPADLVGQEAKVALYAGRAILRDHIAPAAAVERNEAVVLIYTSSGLNIQADGRALGRAAVGERIRVMNLSSKSALFGTVQPDGTIRITH